MKTYRQGDVLLIEATGITPGKKLPREDGGIVLAHGEVTGHKHQIRDRGACLYALEDNRLTDETAAQAIARIGGGLAPDRLLVVTKTATLKHEEHDPIKLPPGQYTVRLQREYHPEELRQVAD